MKINSVFLTFPIFETKLKITSQYEKFVKSRKLNQFELHSNNYEKENEELTLKTEYLLNDFLIAVCKQLNFNKYRFKTTWIQKYKELEFHDCHVHNPKAFSIILYVDCTKDSAETMFYNPGYPYFDIFRHKISPEKGKVVVFHGGLPHAALPNKDKKRIVVSGNIDFFNEKA